MTDTPASGTQQHTMLDEPQIPEPVSKQQMGRMLDAIPGRIWFHDCQHKVCFANREAAALFNLEPDELIGRSAEDLLGEEGFAQDKSHRETALSGAVAIWEGWTTYPDGENRFTQRIFNPHVKRDGEIDGYCEFVRDMTEQKRAEHEQDQSVQLLKDAIESLSEGFALFDAQDRLVMCNSRFRQLNEPIEDLFVPGAKWVELMRAGAAHDMFPEATGRIDDWLEEQLALRGTAISKEFPHSDDRWFAYSHRPTREGGFVSTWREITERRRMERELRESEAMIRRVLEACPVPITLSRVEDGTIIYESPAAQALLGYDELKPGMSVVSRWVNPDERPSYLERLRRDGGVDGLEIQYRKADGEEFWTALSSRLIDYRGEEVIVSNLFDLTEWRAKDAELTHQRELLHQAEKLSALGELLAGVSHELNNPLSVLVGQALMLQEAASDAATAARAERIGKAADRCARIVKTFLAMARQEPSATERVDLNEVIESALEVTAYALRTSGIEVSLRLANDLPMVVADPDQMHQMLTNLIVNAQHALQDKDGPRRLHIASSYRKNVDQIAIKVKDNGPGISAEIRSRIFEPLFTTKDAGMGTGMGLALCNRIVEGHGGTIAVESPSGSGASFTIRLPARRAEVDRPVDPDPSTLLSGQYRILVVEDDYDVGQNVSDILEHDGHLVEIAGTGKVALEMIKRHRYDVILSDIRMPEMDGFTFFRILKGRYPDQVAGLAFITGDMLTSRVKELLDASERPYLEKPLLPRDIRDLVDLLTRRKSN